jgi:hypothetical protein
MAYCENCGSKGHDPRQLAVATKEGQFILIGPCCSIPQQNPQEPETEYGLELSSHYGLLAYAKFGGMKVEYRRTPDQMKAWFNKNQQLQTGG